ncbi:class I mannose-6-phosphate isomerase [Deinococcus psychrotolerans]|uniref:Class I mannose-6-phosphate isomerase n=1 Tax=Deinococcus psychrotolerans TaxID=2489213 RepID=A0A3G8Y7M0_9DEIO|nr:type I phosphomannose isomerase catalytic subunit [Deinococcus psychrotolerans]AZI41358.1 class I mannose-6-phosphate isomerase [Deinococcus psychrotolerans]
MTHHAALPPFLYKLRPQYHTRVWGGQHLKSVPYGQTPVGEAWVVFDGNQVEGGPFEGQTVEDVLAELGDTFLGQGVSGRFGGRFPLLIKLLDCEEWLSVQVHPDDEQARELVGEGEFGKTEAWHFLKTDRGAKILAGVKAGTTPEALAQAIGGGSVMEVADEQAVQAGDTVFIAAGTLHALGPGTLLYEVQQSSDTTYRVYDWDRPASEGRTLHLEEALKVTRSDLSAEVLPLPKLGSAEAATLAECPYFRLEVAEIAAGERLESHTRGQSVHALTVKSGRLELETAHETLHLSALETVLISAHTGPYVLWALDGDVQLLRSSLPPEQETP